MSRETETVSMGPREGKKENEWAKMEIRFLYALCVYFSGSHLLNQIMFIVEVITTLTLISRFIVILLIRENFVLRWTASEMVATIAMSNVKMYINTRVQIF